MGIYMHGLRIAPNLFSSLGPVDADSSNEDQEDHTVAQVSSYLEKFVCEQGSCTQV